ncbi:MAG: hopanoid biosynthesis-associated protein HpnK [Thermodesulfobacteriota bacterium]
MKKLIMTGDDFGLSLPVNEAIEEAHRQGTLTATSLMVGAKSAGDAVERAKRLPTLKVGLHLVLVDGSPILPPEVVPDLVSRQGEFSSHFVRAGINFFFRRHVRRQLEAEIRAQFEAFRKTGLSLDHVNAHHHMHLHPTISGLALKVGRDYGMKAMRLPCEPLLPSWRASRNGLLRRTSTCLALSPWVSLLKRRFRHAGVYSNDFVFGMNDSGDMNLDLVLRILRNLPPGVTEIYFHPATPKINHKGKDSCGHRDYEALTSPELRQALLASSIPLIAFSDLWE